MAYKQSPASFVKHKSKAVGYMAVGSSAHMHGDPDTPHTDTDKKPTTMDFNVGSGLVEEKGGRRKEFEKAFKTARKAGVKEFTYNVGEEPKKKYTTKLKGE